MNQLNQKIIMQLKQLWQMLGKSFMYVGLTFALVAAAMHVIPDEAVMSKDELEKGEALDIKEQAIRKGAIIAIILAGCKIPSNLNKILQLSKTPGVQSKLLALARTLSMTPAFTVAYQLVKRKIESQETTLNIRELEKDAPLTIKQQAVATTAGAMIPAVMLGVKNGIELASI